MKLDLIHQKIKFYLNFFIDVLLFIFKNVKYLKGVKAKVYMNKIKAIKDMNSKFN